MDLIYRSDYDATLVKLERIIAALVAEQIDESGDFRLRLVTYSHALSLMIKLMDERGFSKEQAKREADARAVREFHGSTLPDLLILLQLCSNADLP